MRILIIVLVLILLGLQYKLWIADGSYRDVRRLQAELKTQQQENELLRNRNSVLEAEVIDLKQGLNAIEERARSELGMVKEGETFFQIIEDVRSKQKQLNQQHEAESPKP